MSAETQNKNDTDYDLGLFHILVIEDSKFIASLLSTSLNEMGAGRAFTSYGGEDAKEKIFNYNAAQSLGNIDIVILDWLMPEIHGREILQWIRSHKSETIKFLPVVICSAYTSYGIVEETRDNGATEVMVKPISAEKLAQRIVSVIDNPRPFIKAPKFFGPDRRRKNGDFKTPDRRSMDPQNITKHIEKAA